MNRVLPYLSLLSLLFACQLYAQERILPEQFQAKVIGVYDGDSITVLIDKQQYKVRLAEIDAPEIGQDFGSKSKAHLSDLVFGKEVSGERTDVDRNGRNICRIFVDGVNVGEKMVTDGFAWHYKEYSKSDELDRLEQEARSKRLGIWSESAPPMSPSDWRKAKAERAKLAKANPSKSTVAPTLKLKPNDQPAILQHWINTASNVRHNSTCRWYKNTKSGRMCQSGEGKACGKCGG